MTQKIRTFSLRTNRNASDRISRDLLAGIRCAVRSVLLVSDQTQVKTSQ